MLKLNYYISAVIVLSLSKVFAMSNEDMVVLKQFMAPLVLECSMMPPGRNGESVNTDMINPCLLGCILKKTEFIDNKGFFNADKGMNNVRHLLKDKNVFAKYEEVAKICLKVNKLRVNDGETGCQRAKLAVNCAVDNKIELPF